MMPADDRAKMFVAAACRELEDFSVAYLEPRRGNDSASTTWSLTDYRVAGSEPETMSAAYLEVVSRLGDTPPTVSSVTVGGRPVSKVTIRERTDNFFTSYAYAVGDVLFVWLSIDEQAAEEAILRLPPPGTDTSALGAPVGRAPDECVGPSDPALVSILPTQIDGQPMRRIWVTYFDLHTENPDDHASQFAAAVGATKYNFIGYLLAAELGHAVGAYRVVGADEETLLRGCAPLLYARPDWMELQVMDGKDVLLALTPDEDRRVVGGCYVRDDVLFWVSGGNVPAYLQALP